MKLERMSLDNGDANVELLTPSIIFFQRMNPGFDLEKFATLDSWSSPEIKRRCEAIDGQFLIKISIPNGRKLVITDRWSSIPIFYTDGSGQFSTEPTRAGAVSEVALFSVVLTRRLWGNMTIAEGSEKIPAGCIAALEPGVSELKVTRYHERAFEEVPRTEKHQAVELANALKSAVALIPDATLFLSGGLDTRTLLAAGSDIFSSAQTVAFHTASRELTVASELCDIVGVPHEKLLFDIDAWPQILGEAISHSRLGYPLNSLFSLLPASEQLSVTGIGLDYMFQGMYLPAARASEKFDSVGSLLLELPCGNRHLCSDKRPRNHIVFEELVSIIENQVARNRLISRSWSDALRLLMFDDASMHYSYTDYLSQSERRRVLIPAFTIGLDALWQGCSPSSVLNKKLMISALAQLDARLTKPKSANNNLPIIWRSRDRVALYIKNGITKALGRRLLEHERRTWPTQGWMAQRLMVNYGREFFESLAEELNFNWLTPDDIRQELDWFQARVTEKKFAVQHCDRENHILYILTALLLTQD